MRVVGFGLRAAATSGSLDELFQRLGFQTAPALALPAFRQGHPLVRELQARGFRIGFIPEGALKGVRTPTRSRRILARYGTGSIAEACALIAAGPAARIILPRLISADGCATAALAQSDERLDP